MSEYEFNPAENRSIDRLRWTLSHISLLFFGVGFFLILIGFELQGSAKLITMIQAGLFLVLGVVSFRPIRGLQRVTSTEGDDINQLMIAMDHLRVAFSTAQIVVTLLILMAIVFIVVLLT